MLENLNNQIEKDKNEMITKVCDLIKIPSVSDETKAKEGKPFGEECSKALKYILDLGEKMGFKTKNIDGYCGYVEFGEGEELVGIVSHLDVVPAEETDWKITKPFNPKIEENKIYGRGAIDDKGPTIAALYAMKAVKDNIKVNKRIRLIIGLNEEKNWKCINYYKTKEEIPSIGFSPDADFPCIYAEKSLLRAYIEMPYNNKNEKINIEKIDCNNNAMNVVPKYCYCELKVEELDIIDVKNKLQTIVKNKNFNIEVEEDKDKIKLTSHGISSHAAHPDLGKNAISQLMVTIAELYKNYNIKNELIEFFEKYINMDYNGNLLKINKKDESGELTLNLARFELEKETLKIGMNLRIPVNTEIEYVKEKIDEKVSEFESLKTLFFDEKQKLFIDKESELVTILTNIFNKATGQNAKPIAIGGATYARAFPNFVSFGANMPGEKDMCHQADEYISIDNFLISAKIYAEAICKLDKLK